MDPILVVDDEKTVLQLVCDALEQAGFKTLQAPSCHEAFNLLEERYRQFGSPQVAGVICDKRQPGWDGVRLVREIRARPYSYLKVILMSGAITQEEVEDRGTDEADSILLKPIETEILIEKARKIFFKPPI